MAAKRKIGLVTGNHEADVDMNKNGKTHEEAPKKRPLMERVPQGGSASRSGASC